MIPPRPPPPPFPSILNKRTVFSLLSGILSGLKKKLKWERRRGEGKHLLRSSPIHPVFISSENNSIFLDPTHPFQSSFNPHTSVICNSSRALFSVLFQSTHFYINFSSPHIPSIMYMYFLYLRLHIPSKRLRNFEILRSAICR